MLTLNKLEKVIELEEQLREQYQGQIDALNAKIEEQDKAKADLEGTIEGLQGTIEKQLQTITELSSRSNDTQRIEQLNRELTNRSEKLQAEVGDLKKRVKTMQKELAEVREENKSLKQFDPPRMKKNLDAAKKKLAEETRANDLLQKSLARAKGETAEQQARVKELEDKLAELQPAEEQEEEAA